MVHTVLRSPDRSVRDQLVIAPHHPDRLRRPSPNPGAIEEERFQQTLVWNVFRTLELLPPAFWLRRLHARLLGEVLPATPQIVRISLWQPLAQPPAQCLDGGRPNITVDVAIETEHAMWTLMCWRSPHVWAAGDATADELVARIIDAGAWRAGTRHFYFGVIESETNATTPGTVLMNRYSRSIHSVALRSAMRVTATSGLPRVGAVRWPDLMNILRDCAQANVLTVIERSLAQNVVIWLERVGRIPA